MTGTTLLMIFRENLECHISEQSGTIPNFLFPNIPLPLGENHPHQ